MSVSMCRDKVMRLTKDVADYEKRIGDERKKLPRLQSDVGRLQAELAGKMSVTTFSSKSRQLESKLKNAATVQEKIGDLEKRKASKASDLVSARKSLEQAEDTERKRRDAADKKRRDDEMRHARALTSEARSRASLDRTRLVYVQPRLPERIKVLFCAADPLDTERLQLDEEFRAIAHKLRAAEYRDSVQLESAWAARPWDILEALNQHKPRVVHFSGHGAESELAFQDDDGNMRVLHEESFIGAIRAAGEHVRLVVFNSCDSRVFAEAAVKHIDVAIGMNAPITDHAAREFAAQLYSGIAYGRSVRAAFEQGVSGIDLRGLLEQETPALYVRDGVNASEVILVRPA
jgi:hypothetical protein